MVPSLAVGPDIFGASRSLRRYRLGELGRAIGSATRVAHRIEGEFPTKLKRAMLDAFKEISGAKPTFHSYSVGVPVRRPSSRGDSCEGDEGDGPASVQPGLVPRRARQN